MGTSVLHQPFSLHILSMPHLLFALFGTLFSKFLYSLPYFHLFVLLCYILNNVFKSIFWFTNSPFIWILSAVNSSYLVLFLVTMFFDSRNYIGFSFQSARLLFMILTTYRQLNAFIFLGPNET